MFLNGHYDNTYAIAYACANAAPRLPAGTRAFPVNYWDGMTPDEAAEFFDPSTGLHANKGETAAVLAINPDLVDMDAPTSSSRRSPRSPTRAPSTRRSSSPRRARCIARRSPGPGATRAATPSSGSATSRWSATRRSG